MTASRSFLVAALLAVAATASAESVFDGHWVGAIEVPTGVLKIDVDFRSDDAGVVGGDISIPIQSLIDVDLSDIAIAERTIRFRIPGIPGDPSFEGTLDEAGEAIAGSFTQGDASLEFRLAKENRAARVSAALEGLDAEIERALSDFNVPGLGIAIVLGDELVYTRGFGYRDLDDQLPMTPDSLFAIGSTTKAMTSTVLGMLVDEGLMDWDQPIRRYLPSFNLADATIAARVTPRDLVTHRTGLPRHDMLWYNYNEGSRADLIARFEHLELTADLRERFQYNNLMYMTAGYLAGQLAGGTWEDTVRVRLFEPLGMTRSNFSVAASQNDPDHARPHYANDDDQLEEIPFRSIDLVGPAGSVNSSVNEMARWLRFNLDGGRVGGKALISQAALADIQSPHMTLPDASTRGDIVPVGYAMGWEVSVYRGHRRVAHGGGIDGFATSVVLFPDDHLGLVAFTNSGSVLPDLFNRMAADRILGLESVEWVGEALERHRKRKAIQDDAESKRDADRKANTKPSHPITEYAGSYAHPGYGVLTISGAPGKAALSMSFNGIDAPLEHWHYDVWKGTETDGDGTFQETKLLFRTDYSGDISAVEVPLERAAAPIVFTKQPDPQLSDPAYLQRFVGDYNDAETGTPDLIALSGNQLQLILPGQPVYTLVPAVSGRFDIKGLQGYAVGFTLDADGQVLKITYYQPNGVFESARVKE
ncbi:MAG: serine hydrolase [Xanthomonadales bacterium]|nr:serine hydrolase [Xanthomonadales bacterium]